MGKQRILICVAIVFMLSIFTPRSGVVPRYHPLVINVYQPATTDAHDYRPKFWHDLTGGQIAAVLPGFDQFAAITSASAEYFLDSQLNEVRVEIERPDAPEHFRTGITLFKSDSYDFSYWEEYKGFTLSDVHGVPVVAYCIDLYGDRRPMKLYRFSAIFPLNGIIYHMMLYDEDPASIEYHEYLEMLVNEIILTSVKDGLTADLSVLDNPENPGYHDDYLTLEEACADPDFGAYVPEKVPGGFVVDYVYRIFSQTSNFLRVCYQSSPETPEADYTNLFWTVSEPDEATMTRARDGSAQHFCVLIDDVMIYLNTWFHALPEQAWEMLEQVIAQ